MSSELPILIDHLRGTDTGKADAPAFVREAFEPIHLPGVRVHYMMAEMPMSEAMAALPPSLSPSIPAHCTITAFDVPDSPAGKFSLVLASIGCRSGIRPRMLTRSAFVSGATAQDFLWKHSAIRCDVAEVGTQFAYHATITRVALGDRLLLDAETFNPEPIVSSGAAVKFCPQLSRVSMDGNVGLVQGDMSFIYHATERGTLRFNHIDGPALGLGHETPSFLVCGVRTTVDVELRPSSLFFDLTLRPGEDGVRSLANER